MSGDKSKKSLSGVTTPHFGEGDRCILNNVGILSPKITAMPDRQVAGRAQRKQVVGLDLQLRVQRKRPYVVDHQLVRSPARFAHRVLQQMLAANRGPPRMPRLTSDTLAIVSIKDALSLDTDRHIHARASHDRGQFR